MAIFPRTTRTSINTPGNITGLETITQVNTQTRVGTNIGVSLSTQTQTSGDILRDVNIQPFMRSRVIRITAKGLKPSSRLYAFFDGVDVSSYITPTNSSFTPTGTEGSTLTTNSNGDAYATFRIPNEDAIRFRTGEKVFRLTDSFTNSTEAGLVTTSAQATYASQGLVTQTQDNTVSTTVPETVPNTVAPVPTVQDLTPIINGLDFLNFGWIDPIAQSFTIDTQTFGKVVSSGAYLTKIDLYFAEKDSSLPVTIEIREIDPVSNYPTPKVIPYSRVILDSSLVNVSDDGSSPTPVYFPSPVYVQNGKTYAIVILPGGGSPNYRVWVSRLGDNDIVSGNRITSQPAAGILFASSNDRTYTALQEEDLKFKLYFANFDVASSGDLVLKNEPKDFFQITSLSTSSGFRKVGEEIRGETYLKGTFAPGQGIVGNVASGLSFAQGMTSGSTGILTYLSTANGDLRLRDVRGTFRGGEPIRFRLASNTGTIAGNSTGGIKFATYPTGKVSFYDPVTQANTYLYISNVSYSNSGPSSGTAANNRTFLSGRYIRGRTDGVTAYIYKMDTLKADLVNIKGDFITPSNTSVTPYAKFATSTSTRDSEFVRINVNADTEFANRRFINSRSAESNTSLSSSSMKDGSLEVKFSFVSQNRYASPVFDTSRISATVVETLLNDVSTNEANTVSGGDSRAKYITRKVVLAEGQDAEDLKVYVDAYAPPGTNVKVYFKVVHREDSDTFSQARWMEMERLTASTEVSSSEEKNDFRELEFGVIDYPTGAGQYHSGLFANTTPTGILCYRNSLGAFYEGFKYFAIKIVLLGTNTTNPPRIRNVRAIALQK